MKSIQIPGAIWVIVLAVLNALAGSLTVAYPDAAWGPVALAVINGLVLVIKAIQVMQPTTVIAQVEIPEGVAAAPSPTPSVSSGTKIKKFLLG